MYKIQSHFLMTFMLYKSAALTTKDSEDEAAMRFSIISFTAG